MLSWWQTVSSEAARRCRDRLRFHLLAAQHQGRGAILTVTDQTSAIRDPLSTCSLAMSTRALLTALVCLCFASISAAQPVYDVEGTVRVPNGRPSHTRLLLTGPYQEQYATSTRDNGQFALSVSKPS